MAENFLALPKKAQKDIKEVIRSYVARIRDACERNAIGELYSKYPSLRASGIMFAYGICVTSLRSIQRAIKEFLEHRYDGVYPKTTFIGRLQRFDGRSHLKENLAQRVRKQHLK